MNTAYAETEPSRAEVDNFAGPTLLEFGSPWCGYCRRAQPLILLLDAGIEGHGAEQRRALALRRELAGTDRVGEGVDLARFDVATVQPFEIASANSETLRWA